MKKQLNIWEIFTKKYLGIFWKWKDWIRTWNPKQPFIHGCFSWMIPNLYIENGCFTKHPFINGCLGFQGNKMWFQKSRELIFFLLVGTLFVFSKRGISNDDAEWTPQDEMSYPNPQRKIGNLQFQGRYNTPLEHTPTNPPRELWKESRLTACW